MLKKKKWWQAKKNKKKLPNIKFDADKSLEFYKLFFSHPHACVLSHLLCPTLCNPLDSSLSTRLLCPWNFFFQARILEWVAISFSRRASRSRDQTLVSYTAGGLFTVWATSHRSVGEIVSHFCFDLHFPNASHLMVNIFLACWLVIYTFVFFEDMSIRIFWPFENLSYLSFFRIVTILHISWIQIPYQIYDLKVGCFFTLMVSLEVHRCHYQIE